MKKLAFIFLFIPVFAIAQRSLVIDSIWITNSGGVFFENHINVYDNGETDGGYSRRLGDTTTLVSTFSTKIEGRADGLATDALIVSGNGSKIKELIRQGGAIAALVGINPLQAIQNKYAPMLTDTAWQIKYYSNSYPLVFTLNQAGTLRYKIDTFQTRNATVMGKVIRLKNFQFTGNSLDLYYEKAFRYISIDQAVLLKPEGAANKSRSISTPTTTPVAPTITAPKKSTKTKVLKQ